ncbi:Hypothetical predicted protein [Olea europaea subsp. europaea]|uniref:Uncharacterized protein n=1 Tax=Olea europaea subsp. europaea TaxID=158383 RepID=A0A8S0QJW1_OLEEU|nr:Hypothetical predicted protein [Olea europaea subsp. europaea]
MPELLKSNTFATHAVAAAGSVAVGTVLSYPLDTLKVLIQLAVCKAALSCYDKETTLKLYGREDNYMYVSEALMSGLAAGSVESLAISNSVGLLSTLTTKHANTIDALKEYPWMMTGSGRPPPVSNVRRLSDVISLEEWGALWRGLRPGLVQDSIFGGIFFSSWQFLHGAMMEWKAAGMDPIPRFDEEIGPSSLVAISLAAGVSGIVAAAASHS